MRPKIVCRNLKSCENIIRAYYKNGGLIEEEWEGVLGLGRVVCSGDGMPTVIIQERYLNPSQSYHTVEYIA